MPPPPVISVFGSSAPDENDPVYHLAHDAGTRLARAGFRVQTGGYGGTMAATSRGAAEAGGHVIGVTADAIEAFRPTRPNEWVAEEVRHPTLQGRLAYLVEHSDGVLVLPGGVGTLAELALTWNLVMIGEVAPRPIVCLGGRWAETLGAFLDPEHVTDTSRGLVELRPDPESAVARLSEILTPGALRAH